MPIKTKGSGRCGCRNSMSVACRRRRLRSLHAVVRIRGSQAVTGWPRIKATSVSISLAPCTVSYIPGKLVHRDRSLVAFFGQGDHCVAKPLGPKFGCGVKMGQIANRSRSGFDMTNLWQRFDNNRGMLRHVEDPRCLFDVSWPR